MEMRELLKAPAVELPGVERPRRLRATAARRRLVRETRLDPAQLIAPLFVISGRGRREEISALRGHARLSPDLALVEATRLARLGVGGTASDPHPGQVPPAPGCIGDEAGQRRLRHDGELRTRRQGCPDER